MKIRYVHRERKVLRSKILHEGTIEEKTLGRAKRELMELIATPNDDPNKWNTPWIGVPGSPNRAIKKCQRWGNFSIRHEEIHIEVLTA